MLLAEIKGAVEGVECDGALGPIHRGRKRQPDARDDAVGAPGVQNLVNCFAFVSHDARFGFHGDDFHGAHRSEIAQIAVSDRADSARSAAEKTADGSFDDRRGIAAQLPAGLARFIFECAKSHAGLANGDAIRLGSLRSCPCAPGRAPLRP